MILELLGRLKQRELRCGLLRLDCHRAACENITNYIYDMLLILIPLSANIHGHTL